jgi:hypothetical protein
MTRRFSFWGLVILASQAMAQAERWLPISQTITINRVYIDTKTLRFEGAVATIWARIVDSQSGAYSLYREQYDTSARRWRLISGIECSASGNIRSPYHFSNNSWMEVPTHSIVDAVYEILVLISPERTIHGTSWGTPKNTLQTRRAALEP